MHHLRTTLSRTLRSEWASIERALTATRRPPSGSRAAAFPPSQQLFRAAASADAAAAASRHYQQSVGMIGYPPPKKPLGRWTWRRGWQQAKCGLEGGSEQPSAVAVVSTGRIADRLEPCALRILRTGCGGRLRQQWPQLDQR